MLSGLFSLQSTQGDNDAPDLTVYRSDAGEAGQWLKKISRKKTYAWHLLRLATDEWEVYDRAASFVERTKQVTKHHVSDSDKLLEVGRAAMLQDARATIGSETLSLLGCLEGHANASAADRSNFAILCRRLVMEANPSDLHHFYLLDHKKWPCRMTGLYAEVGSLSAASQDMFLERYKWLSNSWPLNLSHHVDTMADHLVHSRSRYMLDLLSDCGRAAGLSGELILTVQSRWMMAPPGARYRFAQRTVECLRSGMLFTVGGAETFSDEVIKDQGRKVLENHQVELR